MSRPRAAAHRPVHVPLRRCVACRSSRPQGELLRFYRDPDGQWQHDATRRAGGRGAWLCRDRSDCHDPKRLRRAFRQQAERVAELARVAGSAHRTEG